MTRVGDENEERRNLEQIISAAFAAGDHDGGLAALRRLAGLCPEDAAIQHRLAVVEEQIGSPRAALRAHLRSVELAPRNPLAYLYAGFCLQRLGREQEAVSVWSLGSDLDPRLLQPDQTRDPGGLRRNAAARSLRGFLSALHLDTVGATADVSRVAEAIWVQTHDRAFRYREPQQRPHLFYLPGLPAQPWYEPGDWGWATSLEARTDAIVGEFLAAQDALQAHGRPYLDRRLRLGPEFAALSGSLNWTALDLYRDGELQPEVAERFPQTMTALAEFPHYGLGDTPFEIFFSVLKPGQKISPHYGLSNHSVTVHLPLIVPDGCALTVAGERRCWRPGQLLAFDDSYLHDAFNSSTEPRVVLIFSVWHPALSAPERDAVRRSFLSRREWLTGRRVPAAGNGQSGVLG